MMAFRHSITILLITTFICRNAGQQLPVYVIENNPGCVNTSVTSWNITKDFGAFLKFKSKVICTLAGIPGEDPFIQISVGYIDRITCGIDVNQKQTYICFTNAVNISDAGVYSAQLTTSTTLYNNTLYVMKPPTEPIIRLQGSLINQRAQNLTCYATSTSKPVTGLLLSYSWTVNSFPITDSRFTLSGPGNNVLMINRVRKEDNGKKIRCIATEDKGISSVPSDQATLDVLYKPEVSTTTSSPYKIVEGQTATVTCSVTAANPNTNITWSWIKTDSPSSVLHTDPTYTISNIQRGLSGTYNCTATNSVGMSTPATIQVDVQYKPEVSTTISSPYKIVEGQIATMTCNVTAANPNTNITWSWIKTDSPSNVLHTGPTYTISNIQRGQSGTYNCRATNSIGMSTPATIQVDVQYKPEVSTAISSPYKIVEGQTATMSCNVTAANPNTGITWSWIKTDSPSNVLHTGPTYTISNIQRGQSGTYSCRATNSRGMSTPATIQVDVQYKPEVSTSISSPYKIVEGQTATMTCSVIAANPNTGITWRWIKTDSPSNVLHTGPAYTISNIQRGQSGTYSCTATNSRGVSTPATIQVDVQYGPTLVVFSPDVVTFNKTENQTVPSVSCSAVCNPNCTYRWTGVTTVNSGRLDLGVLTRTERGNYTCTANNTIKSSSRIISVYVNYPPTTEVFQASGNNTYEESSPFSITCMVDSYPLSDINILNEDTGEVKASDGAVESLTYRESSAKCYHTANYICHSKNSYGSTSSIVRRIFILCRPRPLDGQSSINIGIKTNEGLNISTTFIGYPIPVLSWTFKKNLTNDQKNLLSEHQISSLPLNVSTIQTVLTKGTLNEDEFGYYSVKAITPGKPSQISIVTYHVIPERKPNPPYNISIYCKGSHGTAVVNWVPGFDGGAEQRFFVSYRTNDDDERVTTESYKQPNATITGLEDDTLYYFKVIANNTNGKTLSEEEENCKTQVKIISSNNLPIIAGGAAGGVVLAGLVVIGIVLVLRRINSEEGKKDFHQSKRVLNEDEETEEEDGVKDNILYISAGPREEEKPGVSGAAVYAEVKKKGSASDSNANVYAEVQKSGTKAKDEGAVYSDVVKPKKGLFKKEVKPKQKKEKKQKMKKEIPDVYENSEDIAMTQNMDNVYSNTADKNDTQRGSRGYKNQDGLLYVEVQFDPKQENGKPVIHGEDEKTDYATVEFPFPPSSNMDVPQK